MKSAVIISDDLDHSKRSVAVYLSYIFHKYDTGNKRVYLWSDKPLFQFKNRFMYNLMDYLVSTFHLKCLHWNFFHIAAKTILNKGDIQTHGF